MKLPGLLAALPLMLATPAWASERSYTSTIDMAALLTGSQSSTGNRQPLWRASGEYLLPAFDPSRGTLSGFQVSTDMNMVADITLNFADPVPASSPIRLGTLSRLTFLRQESSVRLDTNIFWPTAIPPYATSISFSLPVTTNQSTERFLPNAYLGNLILNSPVYPLVQISALGADLPGMTSTVLLRGTASTSVTYFYEAAAVPEPATWATMILGFGIVGNAMRRRHRMRRTAA